MPSTLMASFWSTQATILHTIPRIDGGDLGIVSKWREKRYFAEITKQTHQSDLPRPCPFILSGSTDTSSCCPARRGLYPITYISILFHSLLPLTEDVFLRWPLKAIQARRPKTHQKTSFADALCASWLPGVDPKTSLAKWRTLEENTHEERDRNW